MTTCYGDKVKTTGFLTTAAIPRDPNISQDSLCFYFRETHKGFPYGTPAAKLSQLYLNCSSKLILMIYKASTIPLAKIQRTKTIP